MTDGLRERVAAFIHGEMFRGRPEVGDYDLTAYAMADRLLPLIEAESRARTLDEVEARLPGALDSEAVANVIGPLESGEVTLVSRILVAALRADVGEERGDA